MANKFNTLRAEIDADPHRRQRVEDLRVVMDLIASLRALRTSQNVTQAELARRIGVSQPVISQFEHGVEMNVTTLIRYVGALGGRLAISARMGDGEVPLALAAADKPVTRRKAATVRRSATLSPARDVVRTTTRAAAKARS